MDWLNTGMHWMIDVTIWSQQFDVFAHFCKWKLIHSHPNNSRRPFFRPNCKSIMVTPMNVKEFDNFRRQLAIFRPNVVQNCEFRFLSKMLNFAISFVFRPKRISCVPTDMEYAIKIHYASCWNVDTRHNMHIYILNMRHLMLSHMMNQSAIKQFFRILQWKLRSINNLPNSKL